jgi:hypothetical protein
MSMATTEDLKAYASRLGAEDLADYQGSTINEADTRAGIVLAKWYLAHIAEQERVAEERALPITEEWLVSIGGKESNDSTIAVQFEDTVLVNQWGFDVIVCNARPDVRTRGEVLDLLAALKIEPKGA